MDYTFRPMTQASATAIATDWHYPGAYAVYDAENDAGTYADLTTPAGRADRYFEAWADGELAGFCVIEPTGPATVALGFGLRPDLTGLGYGAEFLAQIEAFATRTQHVQHFELAVADFDERARTLAEHAGFAVVGTEIDTASAGEVAVLRMRKDSAG